MPYKCAFGCKTTDVVLHYFPNPNKYPERFKLWFNLLDENLKTLSENDIHAKKRICDIHFIDEHRVRNGRLSALAVPSLHLPSTFKMQPSDTAPDTQPSSSIPVKPGEPKTANLENVHTHSVYAQPSISASVSEIEKVALMDLTDRPENFIKIDTLSTSDVSEIEKVALIDPLMDLTDKPENFIKIETSSTSDENITDVKKTKNRDIQQSCLLKKIKRLQIKNHYYSTRLKKALKINKTFQNTLKNFTKLAQMFTLMQLREVGKTKTARQFTESEKNMAMSLFIHT